MSTYRVECTGDVREVYHVEAESEEDALERWHEGECVLMETTFSEPVDVESIS